MRRRLLIAAPLALAAPRLRAQGATERFPDRPIRVLVPFGPGGNADTLVRILAPKLNELLGQSIIVENRPGGGGAIAGQAVAQAAADGHTLLFDSFGFVVTPILVRSLPPTYERAFVPVANAVATPYVLAVRRGYPAQTLPAFIEHVKANPGLPYGTPGAGTVGHLAGALLASQAGIRLEHAPYRGGADVARDMAAGVLDCGIITWSSLRPIVEDGRVVPLAVTGTGLGGPTAAIKPIAEQGFPGFDLTSWNGLFAPVATPRPILDRLDAALRAAVSDPATQQRIRPTGNEPMPEDSATFTARILRDREQVRRIVAETGMRID
ncbi:MAG: tripartite tricarboxylate transporter substrate-binding protein [Pseudomonadota bacterium]